MNEPARRRLTFEEKRRLKRITAISDYSEINGILMSSECSWLLQLLSARRLVSDQRGRGVTAPFRDG